MVFEEGLQLLAGKGWLAGTSPEFRAVLLSFARWRHFDPGSIVTLSGEEASDLIGLASGTVSYTSSLGMADTPIMHVAAPVGWMGYGTTLLDRPRVVTVEARTEVWVASFPKSAVIRMIDENAGWWRYFMQLLVDYGDISAMIAADLLIRDSEMRCAAVLLRFAGLRGAGAIPMAEIVVPVTQGELAAAANLSRNAAGTILRHMQEEGLIETRYGGIAVRDAAGLKAILDRGK